MKFPGCYRISPVWDRINQPGYDKTNPEKLGSLELLLTLPYPIGELGPSLVCKPNYPGKRPQTVWGCGRIMNVFFDDYDSPHLCVGLLFLILYPGSSSFAASSLSHTIFHTQLCHTPSFTHNFVTHHIFHTQLCHTPYLSHTTLSHTISFTLFHTPSFTHNFVTPSFTHHLSHTHTTLSHTTSFAHLFVNHHLAYTIFSHTTLSHTIFHTQLCHITSFTHHLSHTLLHTIFHTHNFVTHHLLHTTLSHTPSFTHNFVTHHIFHTQLCHTPSFTHIFDNHHLPHIIFHNLATLRGSGTLRGRRSTWRHLPSFFLAGVLQVALGGALGRRWSPLVAGDAAALCVAGVVLGDIYLRFAWQACLVAVGRRWSPLVAVGRRWSPLVAVGRRWSPLVAVGRRWSPLVAGYAAALCVAGVVLGDIYLPFTWQAWHLATSTFVLRGRRATGSIFDTPSFTPLCHTPSFTHHFVSHHFVSHHLSPHHPLHTTLSHTIFHHTICHTPSFTHHLSPHHLSHTILSHTIFDTPPFTHHL